MDSYTPFKDSLGDPFGGIMAYFSSPNYISDEELDRYVDVPNSYFPYTDDEEIETLDCVWTCDGEVMEDGSEPITLEDKAGSVSNNIVLDVDEHAFGILVGRLVQDLPREQEISLATHALQVIQGKSDAYIEIPDVNPRSAKSICKQYESIRYHLANGNEFDEEECSTVAAAMMIFCKTPGGSKQALEYYNAYMHGKELVLDAAHMFGLKTSNPLYEIIGKHLTYLSTQYKPEFFHHMDNVEWCLNQVCVKYEIYPCPWECLDLIDLTQPRKPYGFVDRISPGRLTRQRQARHFINRILEVNTIDFKKVYSIGTAVLGTESNVTDLIDKTLALDIKYKFAEDRENVPYGSVTTIIAATRMFRTAMYGSLVHHADWNDTAEFMVTMKPLTYQSLILTNLLTRSYVTWPTTDEMFASFLPRLMYAVGPIALHYRSYSASYRKWLYRNSYARAYYSILNAITDSVANVLVSFYPMSDEVLDTALSRFLVVYCRISLKMCAAHSHVTYQLPQMAGSNKLYYTMVTMFPFPNGDVLCGFSRTMNAVTRYQVRDAHFWRSNVRLILRQFVVLSVATTLVLANGGSLHHWRRPRKTLRKFLSSDRNVPWEEVNTDMMSRYSMSQVISYEYFTYGKLCTDKEIKHLYTNVGVGLLGIIRDLKQYLTEKNEIEHRQLLAQRDDELWSVGRKVFQYIFPDWDEKFAKTASRKWSRDELQFYRKFIFPFVSAPADTQATIAQLQGAAMKKKFNAKLAWESSRRVPMTESEQLYQVSTDYYGSPFSSEEATATVLQELARMK